MFVHKSLMQLFFWNILHTAILQMRMNDLVIRIEQTSMKFQLEIVSIDAILESAAEGFFTQVSLVADADIQSHCLKIKNWEIVLAEMNV